MSAEQPVKIETTFGNAVVGVIVIVTVSIILGICIGRAFGKVNARAGEPHATKAAIARAEMRMVNAR